MDVSVVRFAFLRRVSALLAVAGALVVSSVAFAFDPVAEDPVIVDAKYPPRMQTLAIPSGDAVCHATFYMAQGGAARPTILLLHGTPGMDGNRDLARVFQRVGYHVLYIYYRGMWGSPGDFSFANSLGDVRAALEFLRTEKSRTTLRVDARRLILVGHSYGGWAALLAAVADSGIREVVSIAGSNEAEDARRQLIKAGSRAAFVASAVAQLRPESPFRSTRIEADTEEFIDHLDDYDTVKRATGLRDRRLLLVNFKRDRVCPPAIHHEPLVAALAQAGAQRVEVAEFDDDHGFNSHRLALARRIVTWLGAPVPRQE